MPATRPPAPHAAGASDAPARPDVPDVRPRADARPRPDVPDARPRAGALARPGVPDAPARPMRADARRNRDAVLDASAELLASRPGASMQELADASGLGRATVYRHFATREDLVAALVARVADEVAEVVGRTLRGAAARGGAADIDAAVTLRQLAADGVALGARWRFLSAVTDRQAAADDVLVRVAGQYLAWVRAAQARGALVPGDPDWIAAATRALIDAAVEADADPAWVGDALVRAFVARGDSREN